MYYRIIVTKNGQFAFRTSKLRTDAAMIEALGILSSGITEEGVAETTKTEILFVDDSGARILMGEEITDVFDTLGKNLGNAGLTVVDPAPVPLLPITGTPD